MPERSRHPVELRVQSDQGAGTDRTLAAPIAPICRQGKFSGVLRARTRRVYGATVYFWRMALASAPTVYVKTAETKGCRCEFTSLTPGEIYLTEVSVMGTAGQSNHSSPGNLMVI